MSLVLDCLALQAHQKPGIVLLDDGERRLTAQALMTSVTQLRQSLSSLSVRSVAMIGDNTLSWVLLDLALLGLPVRVVPIPTFFSAAQIAHVLQDAAIDTVVGPSAALREFAGTSAVPQTPLLTDFDIFSARIAHDANDSADIQAFPTYEKVTFTSGSTGNAKGVRLSLDTVEATARAIAGALSPLHITSHLGVLPYATLLENVAGIYAPLLQGVTIHVRRMAQLGLSSPEQFNPFLLLGEIQKVRPQATILVPQLLLALVSLGERGLSVGDSFRFIAVGGGKVAGRLLEQAQLQGLPVYEGYGLSECGSVVTLNLPGANRIGSAGKPLSHAQIRIGNDGEILVAGAIMTGYMNEPGLPNGGEISTGDLGYFDDDGFLHVSGRKKNMFITAFGRNVNPEWVEAELLRYLPIRQVAVFGEAMPRNVAVIVARPGFGEADIESAVAACNATLPDYARIGQIVLSPTPFTTDNGMATANGRVRRAAVETHFANVITTEFVSEEKSHALL